MTKKLAVVLGRRLLRLQLQSVPGALGVVVDAGEQNGESLTRRRIEPSADQRLILPVDHRAGVLRGPLKNGKRGKLEPLPNQLG